MRMHVGMEVAMQHGFAIYPLLLSTHKLVKLWPANLIFPFSQESRFVSCAVDQCLPQPLPNICISRTR